MNSESIRDENGKLIGFTIELDDLVFLYNLDTRKIGTYHRKTNQTFDEASVLVGSGNLLKSLIKKSKMKEDSWDTCPSSDNQSARS